MFSKVKDNPKVIILNNFTNLVNQSNTKLYKEAKFMINFPNVDNHLRTITFQCAIYGIQQNITITEDFAIFLLTVF